MFSITFFLFVAVIAVVGFIAARSRKKNKIPLDSDVVKERGQERSSRSNSAFNEPSTNQVRGGVLPTDNKLSQSDFDEANEVTK